MPKLNLYEAKTKFSQLVDAAAAGEETVICKNGKPLARLIKYEADKPMPKLGALSVTGWQLPEDFDEPVPEIDAAIYDEAAPE